MSDEQTGTDETPDLIKSKKKSGTDQVASFYEVYAYHVLIILSGIILLGAPLVYSSIIGRSGILSGVVNIRNGYCSPFAEPNISATSEPIEDINQMIYAIGEPANEDNFIIADQISFLQSLNAGSKNSILFA